MKDFQFKDALRLLVSHFPEKTKKPALFHSVRVGTYLWNNNYSTEIQIAGLLHDSLEDTDISESQIQELFGDEVLKIVLANSEDPNLDDSIVKEDIVKRCAELSENALIVKMADVYDNFNFYVKNNNNIPEIQRCQAFAKLILKYKKPEYTDKIFEKTEEVLNYEL